MMRDRTTHTWARDIELKIKFAMCERIPIPSSDTMQFSSRPLRPPKAKPQLCTKEEEFKYEGAAPHIRLQAPLGYRLVAPGCPNRPEAAGPFTWASPPSVRTVWARPVGQAQDNANRILMPTVTCCNLNQPGGC